MIQLIKNSELDNEKIPKILTPIQDHDSFDFSKIVVNKPWGYEYLMYSNDDVAIWILHIKKDCLTSMHCHLNKKTILIVLSGEAICATLNQGFNLRKGDGLIIDKKVFHSTQAISEEGIIIMEIETPVKKTDLLRLIDYYGRETKEYESKNEMTKELENYNYATFEKNEFGVIKKIGNMNLCIEKFYNDAEIKNYLISKDDEIIIILNGRIEDEKGQSFEIADIFEKKRIKNLNNLIIKKPLEILKIKNIKQNDF